MKKLFLLVVLSVFFVAPAFSYDEGLARSYEQYFSSFSGKRTAKALQMIPVKVFVESLKKGEKLFIVDVRAPGETGVYGFNLDSNTIVPRGETGAFGFNLTSSTVIPMNEVFKPGNLEKIPTGGRVVIVCKAGHRAMAIATGLRHIGFKNVFVLKGGIVGLANYLTPKNAY